MRGPINYFLYRSPALQPRASGLYHCPYTTWLVWAKRWGQAYPPFQLKTALIFNKNVKAANFNIDTVNQKTYIFGIAHDENEKKEIIQEAKLIVDLKELVTSILLVSDLSRQKEWTNF